MKQRSRFKPFERQLEKVAGTIHKVYMDDTQHRMENGLLYYFNRADDLRKSAEILMSHGGSRQSSTMLAGMALETLIKGIGRALDNPPKNIHRLADLAAHVGIVVDDVEQVLLDAMTEHIYWAGRYTAPRKAADWERVERIRAKQWRTSGSLANHEVEAYAVSKANFERLWTKFAGYYWRAHAARHESAELSLGSRPEMALYEPPGS